MPKQVSVSVLALFDSFATFANMILLFFVVVVVLDTTRQAFMWTSNFQT
jgi:hypothetical protein